MGCSKSKYETNFTNATLQITFNYKIDSDTIRIGEVSTRKLPNWAGSKRNLIDPLDLGNFILDVYSLMDDELIYRSGINFNLYVNKEDKCQPISFPFPRNDVRIKLYERDGNQLKPLLNSVINCNDVFSEVIESKDVYVTEIAINGHINKKIDIIIIGDGYTNEEQSKFLADSKRAYRYIFETEPFSDYFDKFNVRAAFCPSDESGITEPSFDREATTRFGTTFNFGGVERRIGVEKLETLNRAIGNIPHEFVILIANTNRYGGIGLYNNYCTAAIGNIWSKYLVVHEFGHSFAGLADEYYGLATCNNNKSDSTIIEDYFEPWQPNVTIDTVNPKWERLLDHENTYVKRWEKEKYDTFSRKFINDYLDLRFSMAPESDIDSLIIVNVEKEQNLLKQNHNYVELGLYEGAFYQSCDYYRSSVNCMMFSLDPNAFCKVCSQAIERKIRSLTN